jgi:hypothetical protein
MTFPRRQQWNDETLERIRQHLRDRLAILWLTSDDDKAEIESRVMDDMRSEVTAIPDNATGKEALANLKREADTRAMNVLLEQDCRSHCRRNAIDPR